MARMDTKLSITWYIHEESPLSLLYADLLEKSETRNGTTEKDATSIHPSTLSHPAASFAEARIASVKSPEAPGA